MKTLLWSNSGVMTRRDPSPAPAGVKPRVRLLASLCNSVVSASMSATSSFVGKAIAQKVSVKSTKASTTVRASAVNKVRVARALDDARMTLSRADTRDLPARRERTNVAPSRVARAVRSRDRRLTVTAYLHRCDRRARVAPPRVASPTVRRVQDPRDRGSVDRSNRGGSSAPIGFEFEFGLATTTTTTNGARRETRGVVVDARRRSRRVYTHFPRAQAASVAAATAVILSTTAPAFAAVNIELMDKRQENQTGLQLIYEVGRGHLTIHDSTIVCDRHPLRVTVSDPAAVSISGWGTR